MIYITTGAGSASDQPLSLEVIAEVARPPNIPILADAAAENLTIPNVHLQRGATVVAYSGGKALCGAPVRRLVLGDKALLQSAWQFSSPHHGPGRDNKIGKEEIMGMLAAVEAWVRRDHAAEWQTWLSYLDHIAQRVRDIDSVSTEVNEPTGLSNRAPVPHHQLGPSRLAHYRRRSRRWISPATNPASPWPAAIPTAALPSASRPTKCSRGNDQVVADRIHRILFRATQPSINRASPSGNRRQRFLGSHHQLFEQQQPAPAIPRTGGALDRRHPHKRFFSAAHRRRHRRRSGKAAQPSEPSGRYHPLPVCRSRCRRPHFGIHSPRGIPQRRFHRLPLPVRKIADLHCHTRRSAAGYLSC